MRFRSVISAFCSENDRCPTVIYTSVSEYTAEPLNNEHPVIRTSGLYNAWFVLLLLLSLKSGYLINLRWSVKFQGLVLLFEIHIDL